MISPIRAEVSSAIELHIQIVHIAIKMAEWPDWLSDRLRLEVGTAQTEKLLWNIQYISHVWQE